MESELISVIVPIYNVDKYLVKCVDSILNQTYDNLEIILVDDGSTDQSPLLCDKFKEKDSRIKVVHKKNGGLSDARNAGINIATGKYLSFIDSDDYITATMLEDMYTKMKKFDCQISVCNMMRFYEDGDKALFYNPVDEITVYKGNDRYKTLKQPSVCNKLFSVELFEDIWFPVGKYYEDTYVYHELLYKASNVVLTGEIGYWYLSRKGSILGRPQYTKKYFDFVEAVWHRAEFLLKHNVQPYAREACLSYYAALSNAEKNIKKLEENKGLFQKARSRYKRIYSVMLNDKMYYGCKQLVRLVLLRYLPQLHSVLY